MQHPPPANATKLLQAILAKAGLELLLIIVAISIAAYSYINPPIRGAIDVADPARIAGWAYDPREPQAALEVQLFIDGTFAASGRADEPRPDLLPSGAARSPDHGFSFLVAKLDLPIGKYPIAVYAVRPGGGKNKVLLALTKKDYFLEIK